MVNSIADLDLIPKDAQIYEEVLIHEKAKEKCDQFENYTEFFLDIQLIDHLTEENLPLDFYEIAKKKNFTVVSSLQVPLKRKYKESIEGNPVILHQSLLDQAEDYTK